MNNQKPSLNDLKSFAYDRLVILQRTQKELAEANKLIAEYKPEEETVEPVEPVEPIIDDVLKEEVKEVK